jgi:protein tyrosine kinase modulator
MTSSEINIENIFFILRKRVWFIVGVFTAAILLAEVITYQTPKMYSSAASLNFDFRPNNPLDDRGGAVLTQDSYITTQVGILKSLNVAQKVVEGLTDYERTRLVKALNAKYSTLDKMVDWVRSSIKYLLTPGDDKDHTGSDAGNEGPGDAIRLSTSYDWLARAIGFDLEVTTEYESRIVKVAYYSTDPQIAALMADRYAEAYIATNLDMVINPARKSKVWFDEQLKSLKSRLEDAQTKLTTYQQQEGIVSSDERIDIESSHLRSLSDQLTAAQEVTRNAETAKQKLKEVLARGDSLMTFEPVFNNPVVQKIKSDIRDLEGQLVESSNSLGANHPRIKKLQSELAAARNRLNTEVQAITDGIENAADLSKEREHNLEQALETQKQLVLTLKSEHDKIAVLQREVDSAQQSYNTALNDLNTSSMQSMVDQTSVSIVDHATVPTVHTIPSLPKNLAIGAFGGLILGIGMALFMDIFIRKIHSKEDLINELGVPLLGHLKKA